MHHAEPRKPRRALLYHRTLVTVTRELSSYNECDDDINGSLDTYIFPIQVNESTSHSTVSTRSDVTMSFGHAFTSILRARLWTIHWLAGEVLVPYSEGKLNIDERRGRTPLAYAKHLNGMR